MTRVRPTAGGPAHLTPVTVRRMGGTPPRRLVTGAILLALLGVPLPVFAQALPLPGNPAPSGQASASERSTADGSLVERSFEWLAEEAARAYETGAYERASQLYLAALERGPVNGHLLYNLGNAYQRQGDAPRAVHAYRRAQLYLPRDGDLLANLEYARRQVAATSGRIEPRDWQQFLFWYGRMSGYELWWAGLAFNLLFWGLLTLRRLRAQAEVRVAAAVSLLAAVLSLGTGALKSWQLEHQPDAVVLSAEVTARSGTDVQGVGLFVLPAGAEVRTGLLRDDWVQVELSDGRRGWVERRFVGLVQP